ncbi:response regulator [Pseudomonas fulva]|uniref:hybrid sensor histidine kinase/response regulator n=1 Tax=Pseudomonas fulva TaxID=47880 RepID=UPI003D662EA0
MPGKQGPRGPIASVAKELPKRSLPSDFKEQVIRFDWSQTALGALPHWPACLRIAVDTMCHSPFPCAVVWGNQLTVIPNDAYVALKGSSGTLGARFDMLWHDQWESLGPYVFDALAGRSSFIEDPPISIGRCDHAEGPWCALGYTPLNDELGEVAGFVHTIIETAANKEGREHWRSQAKSLERQIASHVSELERIWQLSNDAMMTVTPDLKLHNANPTWLSILGWELEQVQHLPILSLVHPADLAQVQQAIESLLRRNDTHQIETRLRHREGHYHWFSWSARGGARLVTIVGRDITGAREDAMRQSRMLMRNTERMEAVGQLAGGMGNEMNNLLAGIGGGLELLQLRLQEGRLERIEEYVKLSRDSVLRAMELTHRLLAFSRDRPSAPRPFHLNRQLRLSEPLLLSALGPEMHIDWQLDVASWVVCLDIAALENALLCLCANAREACLGKGTVTVRSVNERLSVPFPDETGLPAGDYVALHVADEGHGMPASDVARAFEPFFTSKPPGRGAGLGLSMVYGFVRQSGGYAWIESTVGEGTKVSMLFPRCFEAVHEAPVGRKSPSRVGSGERVLLVDDELNLRTVMREYLLESGFDVTDAADANSALQRFRQDEPFDLVVTDIGLPGSFSGRQVARAMRMLKPEQKILFITGYALQEIESESIQHPGTALLRKPFQLAQLVEQVLEMIDS